jgi:hypothetical protein
MMRLNSRELIGISALQLQLTPLRGGDWIASLPGDYECSPNILAMNTEQFHPMCRYFFLTTLVFLD